MKNAYLKTATAKRYDSARLLPAETLTLWLEAVAAVVRKDEIKKILDLGCGTGRFTASLSEAFDCPVIGVEPSAAMLDVAKSTLSEPPAIAGGSLPQRHSNLDSSSFSSQHPNLHFNIEWKQAAAENLPLEDEAVDLVFMSQVFHHLAEPAQALKEINRVLTPGGYLTIRNGMREENRNLTWLAFFPEARVIEDQRTPRRDELKDLVCQQPFALIFQRVIHQLFASSYQEYFEKISRRGLSSLISLSDEAFANGLREFKAWVNLQPRDVPVFEPVDLFIFRKTSIQPGLVSPPITTGE